MLEQSEMHMLFRTFRRHLRPFAALNGSPLWPLNVAIIKLRWLNKISLKLFSHPPPGFFEFNQCLVERGVGNLHLNEVLGFFWMTCFQTHRRNTKHIS